jgi:hypothetical protein
LPSASKRGLARSKSCSSPPIMIERVPSVAPTSPPLTGASSIPTPRSRAVRASSRARAGEEVLMSTMSEPSAAPSKRPVSPVTASSTSGGPGSMVMVTAPFRATSAGLSATSAPPSAASSSAFRRVRLWSTSSWPARTRLRAIGPPMIPSPTKPTLSGISVALGDDGAHVPLHTAFEGIIAQHKAVPLALRAQAYEGGHVLSCLLLLLLSCPAVRIPVSCGGIKRRGSRNGKNAVLATVRARVSGRE